MFDQELFNYCREYLLPNRYELSDYNRTEIFITRTDDMFINISISYNDFNYESLKMQFDPGDFRLNSVEYFGGIFISMLSSYQEFKRENNINDLLEKE